MPIQRLALVAAILVAYQSLTIGDEPKKPLTKKAFQAAFEERIQKRIVNHQCEDMKALMSDVRYWLNKRNRNVLKTLAV